MDTMWVKTHKVLEDFFQVLTCKKCNRRLRNPHQFLNCGHFACAECIGNNTECVVCKMPGGLSDIYPDKDLKEMMINLSVISETVGLPWKNSTQYDSTANSGEESEKSEVKKREPKKDTKKIINETLNTSVCESTISKSTSKKVESIPKNINKKNKKGETHLHIACRSDHIERVKVLLEAGANPNTKDNAGWTPLQEAVSYGFHEVSEMLLKAGALPDLCGCDNRTALHEAVIIDDCDLTALLIKANANRNVYDNVGKKPRDYCKSKKMSNLFRSLQDSEENIPNAVNETHKSVEIDKTLNSSVSELKVVLYGSNLTLKTKRLLAKFGIEKRIKVSTTFSQSVSHVVVDLDSENSLQLSLELLLTILHGKCILSSQFLEILRDSDNVTVDDLNLFLVNDSQLDGGPTLARENFEKQNPKLFNNCYFYFCIKKAESIKYDGMTLKKDDLSKLVAAGDGILLTREPRPEDIQGSLSPFHVAHDSKHSLHKCTHYIIYVAENSNSHSNRIIYKMPKLKTLPLMWFVESILRYRLLDPADMGLTDQ